MLYFAPLWIAKFQLWGIHSCVRVTLFPADGIESHLVPSSFRRRGDRFGESSSCQEKKPAPVTWDVIKCWRKTDRDTSMSLSPLIPSLFLHSIPQSLFLSSSFHLSTFLCGSSSLLSPSLFPCLKLPVSFPFSPLSFFVLLSLLFFLLFCLRQTVCPWVTALPVSASYGSTRLIDFQSLLVSELEAVGCSRLRLGSTSFCSAAWF